MTDLSVSVPITLSDLERWDARGQIFQTDRTAWPRMTRGQPRPYNKGTQRFVFLGVPSIYGYILWRRTTEFDVVTHAGNGLIFMGSATPPPQWGGVPALQLWDSFYLYVHPLLQNYRIWRGNTCRGMACILESATPPIPRERSSSAPQFWDSSVFVPTSFNAERSNSSW